jgi:predicted transport protein
MANPEEELRNMIAGMPAKTGKSLDEWVKLAKASGEEKHGRIVAHLKEKHGLGHGYANVVAHTHLKSGSMSAESTDDLVEAQYAGAKAALRPWYDSLIKRITAFGPDVELAPKKGYVSLRRSKQFGLIQPSTATRMDIGLVLKGMPPKGRLEAAGSWNAMATHRVRVEAAAGLDTELMGWIRAAYDGA